MHDERPFVTLTRRCVARETANDLLSRCRERPFAALARPRTTVCRVDRETANVVALTARPRVNRERSFVVPRPRTTVYRADGRERPFVVLTARREQPFVVLRTANDRLSYTARTRLRTAICRVDRKTANDRMSCSFVTFDRETATVVDPT